MDNGHLNNEAWAADFVKSLAASKLSFEVQKVSKNVCEALRCLDSINLWKDGCLKKDAFEKLPEQVRQIYTTLSPEYHYHELAQKLRLLRFRCGGVSEVLGRPLSTRAGMPDTPEAAEEAHQLAKLRKRIEARLPTTPPSVEELKLIEVHCEKIGEFCEALAEQSGPVEGSDAKGTDFGKAFEKAKVAGVFKELPLRLIVPGGRY